MMSSRGSSFLAAAAILLAGSGVASGTATVTENRLDVSAGAKHAGQLRTAERNTWANAIYGRAGWTTPRYPRPGWSVRQGQRAACKARNQRRHRRACRKGGRK